MSYITNDFFKCTLKRTVGVFSVLFAFLLSAQANVVCMCVTTPVTFLEVIDGDSIWVKKEGRKVLVHFSEVDAPEINELELRAQIYADGLSLGQELLYKYLAVVGRGNWCEAKKSD